MNLPSDDPFAAADRVLRQMPAGVKVIVCDMHAEASSERWRWGITWTGASRWSSGRIRTFRPPIQRCLRAARRTSATWGCAAVRFGAGRRKEKVLRFMTTSMPTQFDVATGDVRMCGAIAEIDETTGKAISMERVEVQGRASIRRTTRMTSRTGREGTAAAGAAESNVRHRVAWATVLRCPWSFRWKTTGKQVCPCHPEL